MNPEGIGIIMIVDDEPAHIVAVKRSLLTAWPNVTLCTASSLQECREVVTASAPDIALIDLNLPDGRATEFLSSLPEAGRFPVIVMTSQGDEQAAVEALKAGAMDYVVKSSAAFADMSHVIDRVMHDWQARKDHLRGQQELFNSREQLRALAGRLQAVREEERKALAREIHDVLAQDLTCLKIDLAWLRGRLERPGAALTMETLIDRVVEMSDLADHAIHAVQHIATALRPAVLDSLGLFATVEWVARDFQGRNEIPVETSVDWDDLPVDPNVATALFRILQEGLTNVARHAGATRVHIVLRTDGDDLVLRILDNGDGIPLESLTHHESIGLAGMRERAHLLGGSCEISRGPDSGTLIEVRLPRGNRLETLETTP